MKPLLALALLVLVAYLTRRREPVAGWDGWEAFSGGEFVGGAWRDYERCDAV